MKFILTLTLALCLITQATAFSRKLTFSVYTPPPPKTQSFHHNIAFQNNGNLATLAAGTPPTATPVPAVFTPIDFGYDVATVTTANSAIIGPAVTIALDLAHAVVNKIFQVDRALVNGERVGGVVAGTLQIPIGALPLNAASQGVIDSIVLPAADYTGTTVVAAGVAGSASKDFYIYVGGSTTMTGANATVWAYSDIFAQYSANSRPMFGYITVNDALFSAALDPAHQEQFNNAILAEVLHIMGFDFGILEQIGVTRHCPLYGFSNPDKTKGTPDYIFFGLKSFYIQTPSLSQYASIYYDELPNVRDRADVAGTSNGFGLPANQGFGGKIMWNPDTFPGEIMAGGNKLSIFTLLVFQDLNFYSVDLSFAAYYNFGKGHQKTMWSTATCQAATSTAIEIPVGTSTGVFDNMSFCTPDQTFVISSLYNTVSTCKAFDLVTNPTQCNEVVQPPTFDCTVTAGQTALDHTTIDLNGQIFGINSAPFVSTVSGTGAPAAAVAGVRCHQFQCNEWGNQLEVILWNNQRFLCLSDADKTVDNLPLINIGTVASPNIVPAPSSIDSMYPAGGAVTYTGTIQCPFSITELCQASRDRCPNNCSQKGICLKRQCQCQTGLTLPDCSA